MSETTEALIERVLGDVVADHAMWIGDDGEPLDYLPEREGRIADFVRETAAAIAEALAEVDRCGGCRDQGAHRRHCPRHPDYHPWRHLADMAESIGDSIGGEHDLASRAWSLAGAIRTRIEETR